MKKLNDSFLALSLISFVTLNKLFNYLSLGKWTCGGRLTKIRYGQICFTKKVRLNMVNLSVTECQHSDMQEGEVWVWL